MAWALMLATMSCATEARIEDETSKVARNNSLDIAFTTSHNFDATRLELILCALAHITCEHHLNTHLLQVASYARLTATALW